MSTKFGKCTMCASSEPEKRLYGTGVCAHHLAHPVVKRDKSTAAAILTVDNEKLLTKYFQEQSALRPPLCENGCGTKLIAKETWRLKAMVCHIVPKRHFESVMLHPLNRWFGCQNCHRDYDDRGWSHSVTMPVWKICAERFTQFMNLIKDTELKHLPDCFRVLMENPGYYANS